MRIYKHKTVIYLAEIVIGVLKLHQFNINDTFYIDEVHYRIINVISSSDYFAELETNQGRVLFSIGEGDALRITLQESTL